MKVSYHGHSIVKVYTNQFELIIDPFITGNELTDLVVEEQQPDYILLTHGHNDHVGDTVQIAKQSGAKVIAPNELAIFLSSQGVDAHGMNIGGGYDFEFGRLTYTQAFHSSSYTTDEGEIIYTGMPAGMIIEAEGKTIYHAGDTSLFGDMKLIGELFEIDLAFLPIGDNFTMGPKEAALAAEWTKAKCVVPVHYDTFPPIRQNPEDFTKRVTTTKTMIMTPGDTHTV